MKIDKEQIKSTLSMAKLLEYYKAIKTSANQYYCVLHEASGVSGHKTPSLVLHPDSQTITCKSRGCFEGDNIFGVIAKLERLDIKNSYPDILRKASKIAGIEFHEKNNFKLPKNCSDLTPEHSKYLRDRGFEEETIKSMNLKSFYDKILFIYGGSDPTGFKAKTTLPRNIWDINKIKNPRWLSYYFKGGKSNIWFIDKLQDKEIIYLVAGEYDLAILQQQLKKKDLDNKVGVITVTTGETSEIKGQTLEYLTQINNKEWRIIYDYDDTGSENMPKRAAELIQTGKKVFTFEWRPEMNKANKDGFDINDYLIVNKNTDIFLDPNNFKLADGIENQPVEEKIVLLEDPINLDDVHDVISKIGIVSKDITEICAAICISASLKFSTPIWLIIIGNPSSFKTELVKLFKGLDNIVYLSSMSENAFASGYIPRDKSMPKDLLPKLDNKTLLIRDLTTMFSLNEETVKKILGDLTSIFDGEFEKFTATRGMIQYKSLFSIIACITPAILSKHHNYMNQLGSRFLFVRVPNLTDENRERGYRIAWGPEERKENIKKAMLVVSSYCQQIINTLEGIELPTINEDAKNWLNSAAEFVSRARGLAVTAPREFTNEKGKTVSYYEATEIQIEDPWRALNQLRNLVVVLALLRKKDEVTLKECETIKILIRSTAPVDRAEVMNALTNNIGIKTKDIADKINKSSKTVQRNLKELESLKLIFRYQNKGPGLSDKTPWLYAIEPKFSQFFEEKDKNYNDPPEFVSKDDIKTSELPF